MTDLANSAASFRNRNVIYWVATSILGIECILGGVMGALRDCSHSSGSSSTRVIRDTS